MTVVTHAIRRGEITDPWLAGMLARKPKKLVAVALANKMARTVWALTTKKETYRVRTAGLTGRRKEKEAKSKDAVGEVWAAGRRNG